MKYCFKHVKALLALEDGTIFDGLSFGADVEKSGEIVFNTSLFGYQEILTDPSYKGQIITFTNPLIGNYGVNPEDAESRSVFAEGIVVREASGMASNWRSKQSLPEYLKEHGIPGIEDIDTRALTRHIRLRGAMKATLSTKDLDPKSLVHKARISPGLIGRDLVKEVSISEPFWWSEAGDYTVVVLDCGVKYNILRILADMDCRVVVLPPTSSADAILAQKPDGLLLSNGPGDPEGVPYTIDTIRTVLGKIPIFGICLGQQLLGLALGGKTYKLKFGHHGGNHPVRDLRNGRIVITAQNHGFCIDIDTLNTDDIEITHMNLNDHTLEGIQHRKLPAFSVQFHPECSPGPHDASYLFEDFIALMEHHRAKTD